jgi:hypothetical protein
MKNLTQQERKKRKARFHTSTEEQAKKEIIQTPVKTKIRLVNATLAVVCPNAGFLL